MNNKTIYYRIKIDQNLLLNIFKNYSFIDLNFTQSAFLKG